MIRLLVADDHPVVRAGLQGILAQVSDMRVVGQASNADELLTGLRSLPVDVLLMDVSMPGPGFVPLLRQVRADYPSVAILVLSVHPEDQYATRALRGGARGYLTKDHSPDELVSAVRKVHRGGRYISASLAERLAAELSPDGAGTPHEQLSDREFDVLCLLGSGRTVTEVARELVLSVKTVSTYRKRVLDKMAMASNADLVRYVAAQGLMR